MQKTHLYLIASNTDVNYNTMMLSNTIITRYLQPQQLILSFLLISFLGVPLQVCAYEHEGNLLDYRNTVTLEILEDETGQLELADILKEETKEQFKLFEKESFNFGLTTNTYWLRLTFPKDFIDNLEYLEVVNPYIDKVIAYVPSTGGRYDRQEAGDSLPFENRPYASRTFVFNLASYDTEAETTNYYLQFKPSGNLFFLINIWSDEGLHSYLSTSQTLLGLYFGLLLIVTIYSVVMCLRLREESYGYYFLHMCGVIAFMLSTSGLGYQYLWTDSVYLAKISTAASTGLFILTGLLLCRVFLHTSEYVQKLDRLMLILMGLAIMQIIISAMGAIPIAAALATSQAILTPTIIWLAAVTVWMRGYRPARFLVLAWTLFLVTIIMSGLTNTGLLPATNLTVYAMHIGSTFEVLLLSLALADRMALMKREKEQTRLAYLSQLKATNIDLENMVESRTQELKEVSSKAQERALQLEQANEELKELSTRDGLTGLLNHQTFFEQLKHAIDDGRRYEYYLSILLMDIDNFKNINDRFGHLTGNDVLKEVSGIIKNEIRESDIAGRFGGEEFVILLSHATMTQALEKAETIRNSIEHLSIEGMDELTCTVSIGVTTVDWHIKEIDYNEVLKCADNAMYEAKQKGKNRIGVAELKYKVVNGKS